MQQAVDAGLRSVSISLDGIGATHDAQRGARGSYAAAMAACERVASSSLVLTNNSQINRLSLPELPTMARALASLGLRAWQIQLTVPMGNAADRPALLLQPFELRTLFSLLVRSVGAAGAAAADDQHLKALMESCLRPTSWTNSAVHRTLALRSP